MGLLFKECPQLRARVWLRADSPIKFTGYEVQGLEESDLSLFALYTLCMTYLHI